MNKDMNGHPLVEYQVVIDPYGNLLTAESFLSGGQVKCRNGCIFIYWHHERLECVNCKEDLV